MSHSMLMHPSLIIFFRYGAQVYYNLSIKIDINRMGSDRLQNVNHVHVIDSQHNKESKPEGNLKGPPMGKGGVEWETKILWKR